ncbi:MAG: M20 family peptidase [Chloroflexi bacterium]|nr:MAG: M20 family peptidase [Chloroflexota bacterium]
MTYQAILRYLENCLDSYLADLQSLVAIDSGSQYKAGVDAVNDRLTGLLVQTGFTVSRYPQPEAGDNLLAKLKGRGQGRILLVGHTDTVYPVGTAARRPMTIQGDKVLGPGTCDMKAGLLSGIYAVRALQAVGFDGFGEIAYLAVSDEETDPRFSTDLIRAASREADAVLVLEAARENGDIVSARKGVRWYTIEVFGKAAHAGVEPEKGRSAVLALAGLVTTIDRLNGLRPGVTLNTGYIHGGGDYPSIVADYAKARVDLRGFSRQDMDEAEAALRQLLADPPVPGVQVKITLEESSAFPPMERTPETAALEAAACAVARELGFTLRSTATGGASDACLASAEGIPTLDGLGPVGGLDHSPDEYIRLSSIAPRTALLAGLIIRMTAEGERWKDGRPD